MEAELCQCPTGNAPTPSITSVFSIMPSCLNWHIEALLRSVCNNWRKGHCFYPLDISVVFFKQFDEFRNRLVLKNSDLMRTVDRPWKGRG